MTATATIEAAAIDGGTIDRAPVERAQIDRATIDWAAIRSEGLAGFTMSVLPPTIQLPALPHAVTLFMERSADENVPLNDLSDILETDAGLTVEVLKYINSSFLARRQKTRSVYQALSLLGRRQSRTFVFATGTEAALRSRKSKLINHSNFWNAACKRHSSPARSPCCSRPTPMWRSPARCSRTISFPC